MMQLLAQAGVALAAAYLLCLGAAALFAPARAKRFLLGFAGSPAAHYLEMALRLLAGASFVLHAPAMRSAAAFAAVGWLLLGTTAVLALVPWRLHRRFAERTVPQALGFLPLIGVASLAFGGLIAYGWLSAPA